MPFRKSALAIPATLLAALAFLLVVTAAPAAHADGPGSGSPWIVSVGDSYISGEAGRWAGSSNTSTSYADAHDPGGSRAGAVGLGSRCGGGQQQGRQGGEHGGRDGWYGLAERHAHACLLRQLGPPAVDPQGT